MSDGKAAKKFLDILMGEFEDNDIGQMFLSAAIVSGALDISKRNPDHVYQGYIRGRDWISTAQRVLELRDELAQERLKESSADMGQRC